MHPQKAHLAAKIQALPEIVLAFARKSDDQVRRDAGIGKAARSARTASGIRRRCNAGSCAPESCRSRFQGQVEVRAQLLVLRRQEERGR
jgi:hypothetical protein